MKNWRRIILLKKILTLTLLSSVFLLAACGEEEVDEEAEYRAQVYQENVQNAPEINEDTEEMIIESRGQVIDEEEEEDEEGEVQLIEVRNSFSPGEETREYLSSLTREELLELDEMSHISIFINGVIRDEYTVAAHTLYGSEAVESYKEEFRNALITETGEEDETTYVDRLSLRTQLDDGDVARHHVDTIIDQLNRVYINVVPGSDFGSRIVPRGQVYPILLNQQLQALNDAAFEFVGVEGVRNRNRLSEEEIQSLNQYYTDSFGEALVASEISLENANENELGGFIQNEEGVWEPAQMGLLGWNILRLVYNIN